MTEESSVTQAVDELERTLAVCEEARAALARALESALAELEKTRSAQLDSRRRDDELSRLGAENVKLQGELQRETKSKRDFDAERAKLLEEVNRAMESAEQVRREGIQALEEARDLKKKG